MTEKNINVGYIARVEGQGELKIKVSNGKIEDLEFGVFEPPKFFEAFLRGRRYYEVHEITSRICGICPVPHQIAALRAVENAMGIEISEQTVALRRLIQFGSHIQSHILNLYLLAAPDYLGCESAFIFLKDHSDLLKRGLKLKKLGNDVIEIVGGRAVHPISMILGGFTSIPSRNKLANFRDRLVNAREDAIDTVRLFSELDIPSFKHRCDHIAISRDDYYAINEGRLVSTEGLNAGESEYRANIEEVQSNYSWAKHSIVKGRGSFLVGPLARVNINFDYLSDGSKKVASDIGFKPRIFQPFKALVARSLEVLNYIEYSIDIIDNFQYKDEEVLEGKFKPKEGEGFAIVEAPRGILYHNYKFDNNGIVEKADIVTPTAMNAENIEEDLRYYLPEIEDMPLEDATLRCEMLVRAYDPCISCSVHVQKLN